MPNFKLLIAQIATILIVARLAGWLFRKLRQPRVIGLDLGILSQTLFSIMALMALVTTFMTSPLLSRIYPERPALTEAPRMKIEDRGSRIEECLIRRRRLLSLIFVLGDRREQNSNS
jgi:Kef-type K+ transport system membrane component KefB